MPNSELMSIGSFSRQCGLTTSALRFYDDCELLPPAEVDRATGYRLYREDQLDRAILLRRLREISMPLTAAKTTLESDRNEIIRAVDEHVGTVLEDAAEARRLAAVIKASLNPRTTEYVTTLRGPVLTAAIEQILTATTDEPGRAALNGIRLEVETGTVTLTATDRYRLSTRSLKPVDQSADSWSGTIDADDLRGCLAELRRSTLVRIDAGEHEVYFQMAQRGTRRCRLLTETFPDYKLMLDALPPAATRVAISKAFFLRALEECPADQILLRVGESTITLADNEIDLPAHMTGPPIDIWFEMTTLYPAVSTAIGADVLIDLRAPDQPATIRSADHGDLTTLAMPTEGPGEIRE
ncbi:MerR family transcriptional regulator [Rhodococcus sp. G-MC3]|uniref:DNA polymerase III subunit beta family protein n=1 Tax=Rhodococcus sp. G-MC3 TaxID=3046209 RepID=UPI0024BA8535|nr:MerR family transcriptional regulator [Rhodococcus sp. G-MC3]MDJ0394662.1 MerR family transcriptional regulator [Rhodococcus sp. G-MC3]